MKYVNTIQETKNDIAIFSLYIIVDLRFFCNDLRFLFFASEEHTWVLYNYWTKLDINTFSIFILICTLPSHKDPPEVIQKCAQLHVCVMKLHVLCFMVQ